MFTEAELRAKGAKRAVLEYIVDQDPTIPVPEAVALEDAGSGTILRSDHWREFDDLYGVFESVVIGTEFVEPNTVNSAVVTDPQQALAFMHFAKTGIPALDRFSALKQGFFERYCTARGWDAHAMLSEFKVLPQRLVPAELFGTLFVHPNVPERYFLSLHSPDHAHGATFLMERIGSTVVPHLASGAAHDALPTDVAMEWVSPATAGDLQSTVELYDRIVAMPKFQDGYAHMMEFSLYPTAILQVRRFRELQSGAGVECPWRDVVDVSRVPTAIGVTPPDGEVVRYFHGGFLPGDPDWCADLEQFLINHPEPVACIMPSGANNAYSRAFFPRFSVAFGGGIGNAMQHDTLSNIATMPTYLFGMKRQVDFPSGTLLRVFSNGRDGYVKLEP